MKTTDRVLSVSLAAMIALGALVLPMNIFGGFRTASAATVTIETSADDHGKKFFGDSLLQVIITDDSKDSSGSIETVTPDIEIRDDTGTLVTTLSPQIDETGDDTSTFEWYISNSTSDIVPQDPENDAGVTTDPNFLDRSQDMSDNWSIKIIYKGVSETITYTDQPSSVEVDRETSYGSDNLLFLTITDQDANADPTNRDVIITDDVAQVPEVTGDDTHTDGIACTETGDNSAAFECEYQLGTALTVLNDEGTVSFTVKDQSRYMDDSNTDGVIDDTDSTDFIAQTSTDDVSVTIENSDGTISPVGSATMSSELSLTLTDPDRNINSKVENTIDSDAGTLTPGTNDGSVTPATLNSDFGATGLIAYVDADGGDVEAVPLTESADNSGVFTPDLANDQLKISFLADGESPTADNGILEFTNETTDEDIVLAYVDPHSADSADDLSSSQTLSLTRTPGTIAVTESAGINSDFTLTLTDADLNDNSKTKDSYTLRFDSTGNANNEFAIERAGDPIGDLATLEVEINGDHADFGDELTYTLSETGPNTGIFTASLDMGEILASTGATVEDGDKVKFTYHDYMGDTERESSASLTIGRAESAVDLSRDDAPIPPDPTGVTKDALSSDEVVVTLQITDPDLNTDSGSQDTLTIDLGTNAEINAGTANMQVKAEGSGFDNTLTNDDTDEIDGTTTLDNIIVGGLQGLTLKETGPNTGVFEKDLNFHQGDPTPLTVDQWQDMRLTFEYTDGQGDESSAGVTFRGHDSSVQVDPTSLSPTGTLKVTLQDADLNLDPSNVEEFDCSFTDSDMLAFTTEDDTVDQGSATCPTFTETGEDTGVFEGSLELGNDITVVDTAADRQASNIHVTYNEEIDSSGESPDATEIDVPVVTSTGAIQVTPDLVGPGTEITVHVVDADLNETPDGRDTIDKGDGLVTFRSDRSEVGKSDIGMKETGPSTGVFEFKIQLKTDTKDCQDDDLSAATYNADTTSNDQGEIGACPGDLIQLTYDDNSNAGGHSTKVSKSVEVKSWDPQAQFDKDSYGVGNQMTVSISDPDANRDGDVADTIRDVRVYSDSDAVGETVSAIETGKDTGVFKLTTALSATSQSGGVQVKNGDTVTVKYTDDFPADFVDTQNDKDFKFTTQVGTGGGGGITTTPSAPQAKTPAGEVLNSIQVGQQVVLSTTIVNNLPDDQPYVGLIEVRDSSGVTVFLGWGTGTLGGSDRSEVGLSWTPDTAGSYEVRTFVISDLAKPAILSSVQTSQITVS